MSDRCDTISLLDSLPELDKAIYATRKPYIEEELEIEEFVEEF